MVGSPCRSRDFRESFPKLQFRSISSLILSFLYGPILTSTHSFWKKAIALAIHKFTAKWISLLFSMLSMFFIVFFSPRGKCSFFSSCSHYLQWFWTPGIKYVTVFIVSPCMCYEIMELDGIMLVFWSLHTISKPSPKIWNSKRQNGCLRRPDK